MDLNEKLNTNSEELLNYKVYLESKVENIRCDYQECLYERDNLTNKNKLDNNKLLEEIDNSINLIKNKDNTLNVLKSNLLKISLEKDELEKMILTQRQITDNLQMK